MFGEFPPYISWKLTIIEETLKEERRTQHFPRTLKSQLEASSRVCRQQFPGVLQVLFLPTTSIWFALGGHALRLLKWICFRSRWNPIYKVWMIFKISKKDLRSMVINNNFYDRISKCQKCIIFAYIKLRHECQFPVKTSSTGVDE